MTVTTGSKQVLSYIRHPPDPDQSADCEKLEVAWGAVKPKEQRTPPIFLLVPPRSMYELPHHKSLTNKWK